MGSFSVASFVNFTAASPPPHPMVVPQPINDLASKINNEGAVFQVAWVLF
ncbi:unnamed protein product [Eruca vesicaria subsp. sativa]|uniref:Uncharacterized protein n=1 Tax=Eruca vesicaria subsp. sativa TaxID=29727 RepID=A0ABC8K9J2_ERUVS|nr:unnamed protein product [Eruca vesicaria subsp. sativa]